MAKRANPFIEDFVPQSKVHVGIKQFNNNEDRLQKVYEKTLELLFRGSKKSNTTLNNIATESSGVAGTHSKKDKMKQLCIGKDGALSHDETAVQRTCPSHSCLCGSTQVESRCGYCDTSLCADCSFTCGPCKGNYCRLCTLTGCESSAVCVSCYN